MTQEEYIRYTRKALEYLKGYADGVNDTLLRDWIQNRRTDLNKLESGETRSEEEDEGYADC